MANVSNMFGDIKAKLGFGGKQAAADYDEYEEYAEYEDGYEEYSDDYGDYDDYDDGYTRRSMLDRAPVTTREVGSAHPRLVSYADVRENTTATASSSISSRTRSGSAGRTMMDSSLPHSMTPEGAAEVSAAGSRRYAAGLDSLFSATPSANSRGREADAYTDSTRVPVIGAAAHASRPLSSDSRALRIIRPTDYSQVAEVASMLRAGDAVVLVFKSTPESLEKRLLDFSFGVASALSASVDCVGAKVFAITVGEGLTSSEQANLRTQGIL